jgi:predicted dehydrogenase
VGSSFPSPERLVVVGAGPMGREHVLAALALGVDPGRIEVVARGEERARALAAELGTRWRAGGVEGLRGEPPSAAVVAVGVPELAEVAATLAELGCPYVLLEKPGALLRSDLAGLAGRGTEFAVALNRRFYPSVDAARQLIEEDGGPLSATFEFTELEERVLAEGHLPDVLERWGIVNSLHVIDLFRGLAGEPDSWRGEVSGGLPWHPAGATFSGSGRTSRGALFAYIATWGGAGRWSLEVATSNRKLILRPLEELRVQRRGSFDVELASLRPDPDGTKPGLTGQLAAFLAWSAGAPPDERLCTLDDALASYDLTERILGYA